MKTLQGRTVLAAALFLALAPAPGQGQGFEGLVAACAAGNEGLLDRCHQSVLALDAVRGGLALAASGGSDVPGSASTLGFRLRRFPRFALSARGGAVRVRTPDILGGYTLPLGEDSFFLPALKVSATVGIFDGLSPLPSVGGIGALDLTGSLHWADLPEDRRFHADGGGWGVGGRLGILRESFDLPGLSVSFAYLRLGEGGLGDMGSGDPAEVRYSGRVTSLRGIVGKDLLGVGVLAGAGWDRIKGDGSVGVRVSPEGFQVSASARNLESERRVYFAGVSLTYLIFQVSAEGGWARARRSPLPPLQGREGNPDLGAWFGSLGARMTF